MTLAVGSVAVSVWCDWLAAVLPPFTIFSTCDLHGLAPLDAPEHRDRGAACCVPADDSAWPRRPCIGSSRS